MGLLALAALASKAKGAAGGAGKAAASSGDDFDGGPLLKAVGSMIGDEAEALFVAGGARSIEREQTKAGEEPFTIRCPNCRGRFTPQPPRAICPNCNQSALSL